MSILDLGTLAYGMSAYTKLTGERAPGYLALHLPSLVLESQMNITSPLMKVLQMEFRPSYLKGKHYMNLPISSAKSPLYLGI